MIAPVRARLPAGGVTRADVYRGSELAGSIERAAYGAVFCYRREFLEAHAAERFGIAVHLPLTAEPFDARGVNLHPFFANLLPEGARLDALMRAVKSSPDDLLALLVMAGADTVGDVAVVAEGEPLDPSAPAVVDLGRLDSVSFRDLFERSLAYAGADRDRTPIPGIQNKISAAMISFPVRGRRFTGSFVLKLTPPRLRRLVDNELFFMTAARDAGIETADCTLVYDRDREPGLLVRRFDRASEDRRRPPRRVHQEDGCQLLDRYPADKYAVSLADIAKALSVCATPILQVGKLLRLYAYSYVIANGDLHAKNISVYAPDRRGLCMTPAYDVLSTLAYGDSHMALKLAGRDRRFTRAQFVEFAARYGVRAAAVHAILDEVCDGVGKHIARVDEIGFEAKTTRHLARTMTTRRDELGTRR